MSFAGFWLCNCIVQDAVLEKQGLLSLVSVHEENLDKETSGSCWIVLLLCHQ